MTFIRIPLLIATFVTALIAGYKIGEYMDPVGKISRSQTDVVVQPGVKIPDNDQYNLLIIGVDDMNRPDAHLESVWLAAKAQDLSKITLIPVFPSLNDEDLNLTLSESLS